MIVVVPNPSTTATCTSYPGTTMISNNQMISTSSWMDTTKSRVVSSSFLRFYKAKIVNRNAISKQTEDNIKTDADKIAKLVVQYMISLETNLD